ncbi:MAG: PilT/PilU family type 4a pilus ATPase [Acidobacteriota bacterium]
MSTINFSQVVQQMLAVSSKISDLIFSPGRPPQVELMGKLTPVKLEGLDLLTPAHTVAIAKALLGDNKSGEESLEKHGSADLSFSLAGLSRFRVNIFKQRGTYAIVMRVVPNQVPSFEDLGIPPVLGDIAELKNGIVLVTGPTGSGKSSTLAAIIDLINDTKYYHIVTIEDPIEFIHGHKKSTVHQRELHSDTSSFAYALRAALRQAPKVILVGEIRDLETCEVALEASETGHLVLSTLHTTDAVKTVERLIGLFPKSQEHIIRMRLAGAFRFIVSQRLIPRSDGLRRVAAIEVLKSTARTRDYIEKGERDGKSLYDAMRDGNLEGMQIFDGELERMIREGTISLQDGLAYATNRQNLQLQLSDLGGGAVDDAPSTGRDEFIS